jgi:uncharacterized protein (TIGR00369 family)
LGDVRRWIEQSGYGASLGVRLEDLSETEARLVLPFQEANSNPGNALHGGCAASLGVIGAQAVARAALGTEAGPFHTASVQVSYLAAAVGEDVSARATLLRRGKELCFVEVEVDRPDGKPIAHATATVRGRFGAAPPTLAVSAGDHGEADPGVMGPHIGKMPYGRTRGLSVEHMTGGTARITAPNSAANADGDGGLHEGAMLALLDTTGAMAAWAETGPGPYKASTPTLQARFFGAPANEDLVAYGRMVQRDGEALFNEVEAAGRETGRVYATASVLYRIVT